MFFSVSLTQTRKKGLEFKQNLVEEIRKCVDRYARVFVFSSQHIKTEKLKEMRVEWAHSRLVLLQLSRALPHPTYFMMCFPTRNIGKYSKLYPWWSGPPLNLLTAILYALNPFTTAGPEWCRAPCMGSLHTPNFECRY